MLLALAERPGEVLTRQELMASAWPSIFAEDANLRVRMTALRRVLSDGQEGISYIANVARRGYSFIEELAFSDTSDADTPQTTDVLQNPPVNLTPVLGRDTVASEVAAELVRHRFVSFVGPGGVGKTTVAIDGARGDDCGEPIARVFSLAIPTA